MPAVANRFGKLIKSRVVPVAAGETGSLLHINGPCTVGLSAGAGGTMTCQVRVAEGGTARDVEGSPFAETDTDPVVIDGPVYEIIIGAVTEDGEAEIALEAYQP